MKQLYLSLIFVLTLSTAFGQKDFREGYIIQNGDTTKGLLDYRGNVRSSQAATFKSSYAGEAKTYTSEDIGGYGFLGDEKIFESKVIPATPADTTSTGQKVFLRVLVKGRASLYYYRDASLAHRYYLEKDTLFTELVEHSYRSEDVQAGKTYIGSDKKFIGVLTFVFSDCQQLPQSKLKDLSLNHKSLSNITIKYNRCTDGESTSYRPNKGKAKITIGAVLFHSQADPVFKIGRLIDNVDFNTESLLGGGISLNLVVPEASEKLSLQAELLYVPYKFKGTYMYEREFTYLYEPTFDLAYVKLPFQLRYTYPKGKLRPFLNAGLMVGFAVKGDNKATTTDINTNNSVQMDAVHFRRLMHGMTAGVGLTTALKGHPLSLEGRMERNNGVAKNSTLHNLNLILSYGF